jgi:non-ribosomal peptide synthetase component E (peptide arylation enzyme)
MQNLAFKIRYMMSTTANVFAKYNQFREVARFESQNITWAVEELETHGNAVARGLKSLGINKGDTILVRVPENLQT